LLTATAVYLLVVLGMSPENLMAWGWRLPFLASAIMVVVGLWVRLRIAETPEFREASLKEMPPKVPAMTLLARHSGAVAAGAAGVVCLFTVVYINNTYSLARETGALGSDRTTFLVTLLIAQALSIPVQLLAAIRSDQRTPGYILGLASLAAVPFGVVYGFGLESANFWLVAVTVWATAILIACCNVPMGGWLSNLYPVNVRYSGVAFAYNLGGIIGGAVMPLLAQFMSAQGAANYVGLLFSAAGALSFVAVALARPIRTGRAPLSIGSASV
jgi:hypothetical protein